MSVGDDLLIKSYVDVCNQALAAHSNKFPFKQILGAASQADRGKKIEVSLFGDGEGSSYVFTMEGSRIHVTPHGGCHNCNCDRKWQIEKEYLEQVKKDPMTYIQNPAKINWEWLYDVESGLKN